MVRRMLDVMRCILTLGTFFVLPWMSQSEPPDNPNKDLEQQVHKLLDAYVQQFTRSARPAPPGQAVRHFIEFYHDPALIKPCSELAQLLRKDPKTVLLALARYEWDFSSLQAAYYLGEFLYQRPWTALYDDEVREAAIALILEEAIPSDCMYNWSPRTLCLFQLFHGWLFWPGQPSLGKRHLVVAACLDSGKHTHPALDRIWASQPYATARCIVRHLHFRKELTNQEAERWLRELEWTDHLAEVVYFRSRVNRLGADDLKSLSQQLELLANQDYWWAQVYVIYRLIGLPREVVTQKLARRLLDSKLPEVILALERCEEVLYAPLGTK